LETQTFNLNNNKKTMTLETFNNGESGSSIRTKLNANVGKTVEIVA